MMPEDRDTHNKHAQDFADFLKTRTELGGHHCQRKTIGFPDLQQHINHLMKQSGISLEEAQQILTEQGHLYNDFSDKSGRTLIAKSSYHVESTLSAEQTEIALTFFSELGKHFTNNLEKTILDLASSRIPLGPLFYYELLVDSTTLCLYNYLSSNREYANFAKVLFVDSAAGTGLQSTLSYCTNWFFKNPNTMPLGKVDISKFFAIHEDGDGRASYEVQCTGIPLAKIIFSIVINTNEKIYQCLRSQSKTIRHCEFSKSPNTPAYLREKLSSIFE